MKSLIVVLCLLTSSLSFAATSLGGVLGTHVGLVGKYDLAQKNRALAGGLTHAIDSMYSFSLHTDYLFENVKSLGKKGSQFNLYYGIGGRLMQIKNGSNEGKTRIGARIPVGLNYDLGGGMEFFGEAAPALYVVNDSGVALDLGVGFLIKF